MVNRAEGVAQRRTHRVVSTPDHGPHSMQFGNPVSARVRAWLGNEAIPLYRHGALRARRDDNQFPSRAAGRPAPAAAELNAIRTTTARFSWIPAGKMRTRPWDEFAWN